MTILRYYAEYTSVQGLISNSPRNWYVFDRQATFGAGDTMPIALCWTRADAFRIRNLLNAAENPTRALRQET